MTQQLPPAGWFPDPSDPSRLRYFDGRVWTEQYANVGGPSAGGPPLLPPKQGKQWNWKWIAGIGGVFLALMVLGNLGSEDNKKSAATQSDSSSSKSYNTQSAPADAPGASVAPAGSSVRDGQFEFQVLGTSRGETAKEDVFSTERAKGEFFTVKLRVTNVGNDARSFSATNQKLIINGNEYEATSFLNSNSFGEDINPGLGIDTEVVFDIPKGATPSAIECHDSIFSGGALLAL
jgi:hypothetical protein